MTGEVQGMSVQTHKTILRCGVLPIPSDSLPVIIELHSWIHLSSSCLSTRISKSARIQGALHILNLSLLDTVLIT